MTATALEVVTLMSLEAAVGLVLGFGVGIIAGAVVTARAWRDTARYWRDEAHRLHDLVEDDPDA